ncbi:MAG: glucosamine-6-phosphate deaminase [Clostridia bacterium]|nr:glucosamine-6-phosphate deaminase [Clostridia bacterium]
MKIIKVKDIQALNKKAAYLVASQIIEKPNCVLGLATGSTPIGTYQELIKLYNDDIIDFKEVITFNLDEYIGLPNTNPQSYAWFMNRHLFDFINISDNNVHIPNGMAEDIGKECMEYEDQIKKVGGIDLQVMGIGRNGHIGFNEPDVMFENLTHVVELDEQTILDNSRFFNSLEDVPKRAISMGIKTIMNARKILLLATGEKKTEIVHEMIYGRISSNVPATVLQLHPNVIVLVDEAAGKLIKEG